MFLLPNPGRRFYALALFLAASFLVSACTPVVKERGLTIRKAAILEQVHKEILQMPDGSDLPLRLWKPWDSPEKAVIIALHGFNDSSVGMGMPGHGLARRGYIVYAYDQRGFGAAPYRGYWPGSLTLVADLRSAIEAIHARHPNLPLYALGESMGAAIIMAALADKEPLPVDGVILAAPAIWGRQTLNKFDWFILDKASHLLPWVTVRPTGVRRVASNNRSALRRLARDPLTIRSTRIDAAYGLVDLMSRAYDASPYLGEVPTLVLFGKKEGILDKKAVQQFLSQIPTRNVRLALYPRGYHLLLRDFDQQKVFDDIDHWIEHPLEPLPSNPLFQ